MSEGIKITILYVKSSILEERNFFLISFFKCIKFLCMFCMAGAVSSFIYRGGECKINYKLSYIAEFCIFIGRNDKCMQPIGFVPEVVL